MHDTDIEIRPLETHEDCAACCALQEDTWGSGFRELVPPAILMIAQKVGGVAAGAFDHRGKMVGVVFGITGWKDGLPCHWSHMLAVSDEWRDRGVGTQLKHYQRMQLLHAGVNTMYWTFDPLVARNAHVNLMRLGARVVQYAPDLYGPDDRSKVDSVIGSDRFVVAWELSHEVSAPPPSEEKPDGVAVVRSRSNGTPELMELANHPVVRIEIPHDIHEVKLENPDAAREWRVATREAFTFFLDRGYQVEGFHHQASSDCRYYRLLPSPHTSITDP